MIRPGASVIRERANDRESAWPNEIAEPGRHLSKQRGFLEVSAGGSRIGRIALDDLAAVVATSPATTISCALLAELAMRGIPFAVCGHAFALPECCGRLRYTTSNSGEWKLNWRCRNRSGKRFGHFSRPSRSLARAWRQPAIRLWPQRSCGWRRVCPLPMSRARRGLPYRFLMAPLKAAPRQRQVKSLSGSATGYRFMCCW